MNPPATLHDDAYRQDGATNLTTWLRRIAGASRTEANRLIRLANLLKRLDRFAEIYFAELVSTAHLEALADVATERWQNPIRSTRQSNAMRPCPVMSPPSSGDSFT